MDADQRPMTPDAAIDRELQALLAVDPSPGFTARVRARIADDPATRAAWFPRALVVAATAAVVIVAIVVARQLSEGPASERSAKAIALHESRSIALLDARPLPPVLPVLPLQPFPPIQPLRPVPPRSDPEILIDAREASALRSLIRRAGDGRIDVRLVFTNLAPLEDVSIEPIVIVPLEEGARQ